MHSFEGFFFLNYDPQVYEYVIVLLLKLPKIGHK